VAGRLVKIVRGSVVIGSTPELDKFKAKLREFFHQIENLSIENSVYYELVLGNRTLTGANLHEMVQEALHDPQKRQKVLQQFSEMWMALDKIGTAAWIEEMMNSLPSSSTPN
jgi:hypothetical protein